MSEPDPSMRLWEIYYVIAFTATAAAILLLPHDEPVAERGGAAGLILAIAAWYALFGRRFADEHESHPRGAYLFQAGVLVLFVGAVWLVGAASLVLFALCPMAYMTAGMRAGHVIVLLASLSWPVIVLAQTGDLPATLSGPFPVAVIIIVFSTFIAVAISRTERRSAERAMLIEELEATRAEVTRLSREAGIAEERQRLAGDIHDTVAQGLSSVVMLVEAADAVLTSDPVAARTHLSLAARTARENLDETRAIVAALTPSSLAEATLADALGRLAERFGRETGAATSMSTQGSTRSLSTNTEVVLLRVTQEALNNVRKHAGASAVAISLAYGSASVAVAVRDDGVGFDVDKLGPGYGLGAMRARVQQVGGRLSISSTPGSGTTIRTEVAA